jgi:hypothetical protein
VLASDDVVFTRTAYEFLLARHTAGGSTTTESEADQ